MRSWLSCFMPSNRASSSSCASSASHLLLGTLPITPVLTPSSSIRTKSERTGILAALKVVQGIGPIGAVTTMDSLVVTGATGPIRSHGWATLQMATSRALQVICWDHPLKAAFTVSTVISGSGVVIRMVEVSSRATEAFRMVAPPISLAGTGSRRSRSRRILTGLVPANLAAPQPHFSLDLGTSVDPRTFPISSSSSSVCNPSLPLPLSLSRSPLLPLLLLLRLRLRSRAMALSPVVLCHRRQGPSVRCRRALMFGFRTKLRQAHRTRHMVHRSRLQAAFHTLRLSHRSPSRLQPAFRLCRSIRSIRIPPLAQLLLRSLANRRYLGISRSRLSRHSPFGLGSTRPLRRPQYHKPLGLLRLQHHIRPRYRPRHTSLGIRTQPSRPLTGPQFPAPPLATRRTTRPSALSVLSPPYLKYLPRHCRSSRRPHHPQRSVHHRLRRLPLLRRPCPPVRV